MNPKQIGTHVVQCSSHRIQTVARSVSRPFIDTVRQLGQQLHSGCKPFPSVPSLKAIKNFLLPPHVLSKKNAPNAPATNETEVELDLTRVGLPNIQKAITEDDLDLLEALIQDGPPGFWASHEYEQRVAQAFSRVLQLKNDTENSYLQDRAIELITQHHPHISDPATRQTLIQQSIHTIQTADLSERSQRNLRTLIKRQGQLPFAQALFENKPSKYPTNTLPSALKKQIPLAAQKQQAKVWGLQTLELAKRLGTEDLASVRSLELSMRKEDIQALLAKTISLEDFVLVRNMHLDPQYLIQKENGEYEIKNCPTAIATIRDHSELRWTKNHYPKVLLDTVKRAGIGHDKQNQLHKQYLKSQQGWFKRPRKVTAPDLNPSQVGYLPKGGINFLVKNKQRNVGNTYPGAFSITCRLSDVFKAGGKIHKDVDAWTYEAILVELPDDKALPVIELKRNS